VQVLDVREAKGDAMKALYLDRITVQKERREGGKDVILDTI